ncbi:acyltransferase family protein [Nocardioides bruguierae]|uniref:Acyltransferase n=1 Tax=Nocardioides bruguierae TaxID=2945102 RepID=A0A9X2D9W8_9ACTN|nr:acyltransferase family protein [Nocardioides bruguierae]MCM0621841.1 acyltransferase [Nocardioides bruguierae]
MPTGEHRTETSRVGTRPAPATGTPAKKPSGKRLDIQGLRAIAVGVVVLNHLLDWPHGGFVGVDVFFVISGYLITGRLLRTAGTKSVGQYFYTFYKLRARRILPAGLLVIGLTIVAAQLVFGGVRAHNVLVDGGWAAIFLANWHFASAGTNYFEAGDGESPLQHYWSLSVEEQFYVVWPVLVLLAVILLQRRFAAHGLSDRTRDLTVGAMAVVLSLAGFAYSLHQTAAEPTAAYFSTLSRSWELGAGAALACFLPHVRKIPRGWAEVLSVAGVAIIAVAVFITPSTNGFPGPWAAPAVLGSALVIAAGSIGTAHVRNVLLTNRASTFLGDISYSVYLVHFPLVVIMGVLLPQDDLFRWLAVLGGTVGLSTLIFYFVEEPFRDFRTGIHPDLRNKFFYGAAPVLMAMCLTVPILVRPIPPGVDSKTFLALGEAQAEVDRKLANGDDSSTVQLQSALLDSVQATSWPNDLDPAIGDAPRADRIAPVFPSSCNEVDEALTPEQCTSGADDAEHSAVLIGDSITMWLATAFEDLHASGDPLVDDWQVTDLGTSGCSFSSNVSQVRGFSRADRAGCQSRVSDALDYIEQTQPDLVLMTINLRKDKRIPFVTSTLKALSADSKVVFVMPPPMTGNPAECYTSLSEPADCATTVQKDWKKYRAKMRDELPEFGGTVLDTKDLFCIAEQCPAFVATTPTKADGLHPLASYVDYMQGAFSELIDKRGTLDLS